MELSINGHSGKSGDAMYPSDMWSMNQLEDMPAPIKFGQSKRLTGPVQFISKLRSVWNLSEEDVFKLLGFDATDDHDDRDYLIRVLRGSDRLRGRDVLDRIAHLVWIRATLNSVFQDLAVENEWLRESHQLLDQKSPMSLLLEGPMESFLIARDYVDALASK